MHLLAATPGSVDDGKEPVDLSQTPSDVIFISAADTELAALSTARSEMSDPPGLRLASMMHLQHPMSVDLHIESCASKAKLVVARVLGGVGYWKYGFEQYAARLSDAGVTFAALPGDEAALEAEPGEGIAPDNPSGRHNHIGTDIQIINTDSNPPCSNTCRHLQGRQCLCNWKLHL